MRQPFHYLTGNYWTGRFVMNRYNRNNLLKVDLIYKLVTVAVCYPFLLIIFKLALKLSKVEYLTNEYIYKFLTRPTTVAAILLTAVLMCVVVTMEQQLVFAGYEILKKERKRASYLTENGILSMKNIFKPKNFPYGTHAQFRDCL